MIHRQTDRVTLHHGDCLDVLRELPDCSVDAVVTDPPYGLEFMGKEWDAPWKSSGYVVANPADVGGYQDPGGGNAYSRSRIRYGRGVSKAIDKAAGVEREVVGRRSDGVGNTERSLHKAEGFAASRDQEFDVTAPATPDAERWQGWGTALKPAFEPVVVARKPLDGTVAANVLAHGTGALNIDGCRIEHAGAADLATSLAKNPGRSDAVSSAVYGASRPQQSVNTSGRWPANVVLDEDQAAELDRQSGTSTSRSAVMPLPRTPGDSLGVSHGSAGMASERGHNDQGGASRFFYVAKASSNERPRDGEIAHPTVKPLALMRRLVRLVTPPGGTVLEPFAGSGTTVAACLLEGFNVVAIEREANYLPLIVQRIKNPEPPKPERVEVIPPDQIDIFAELVGGE